MIKEEYKENKDGSEYTYKYYDKNDPIKYVIVNRGKIVKKTTDYFIDIVEKDCGSYKRKDYRIQTNEDWKKIIGNTKGDIDCKYSDITSLKGAPSKVGGEFYCNNTKITSLEGAPKEVGGDFSCDKTQITSLKEAPQKIGGNFICLKTKITKEQAIEYLKNNDCNRIIGDFGEIKKSDIIKESCFNY